MWGRKWGKEKFRMARSEFDFKIATRMKNQILLDLKNIKKKIFPSSSSQNIESKVECLLWVTRSLCKASGCRGMSEVRPS